MLIRHPVVTNPRQAFTSRVLKARYQAHTVYTPACDVPAVFLENGGGTLGIVKVVSLHLPAIKFEPLSALQISCILYLSFLSKRSGRLV